MYGTPHGGFFFWVYIYVWATNCDNPQVDFFSGEAEWQKGFNIFFGNRSVWKIFELNHKINLTKQELIILSDKKNYTLSEIELLRDDNLDPDMISEIVQNSLGLIHSDQIVIEITK